MAKYRCKICDEIVVYRSLHFETCHDEEINARFERVPSDLEVTGGNPDAS